jgi:hypothetical protein
MDKALSFYSNSNKKGGLFSSVINFKLGRKVRQDKAFKNNPLPQVVIAFGRAAGQANA